jgi:hypothetical protein
MNIELEVNGGRMQRKDDKEVDCRIKGNTLKGRRARIRVGGCW